MATTKQYLDQLKTDKQSLVNNLVEKGVDATNEETFTSLVPKVLDIQSGGGETVTKGFVINSWNENGYPTDISLVGMTEIPNYYFSNTCKSGGLFSNVGSNFHLPNNLTKIGDYAFEQCAYLALSSLPETITSIGSYAFHNCKVLKFTSLPSGLTLIDNGTFHSCSFLALTSLPENLTSIGGYAFNSCTELALTSLPENLTSIGEYAFNSCTKMPLESLPSGLTSIGSYGFFGCSNLAIKSVPSGITILQGGTFRSCGGLTELTFEGDITSIAGTYVFNYCSNLTKIVFPNVTVVPTLSNTNSFMSTPIASGTGYIYVPDALVDSFKSATNWSTYANQIKGISELPVEES